MNEIARKQANVPSLELEASDADHLPGLTIEARRAKVWDFRVKGVSVPAMARAFGVTEKTIYEDLKAIGEYYRDQLVNMSAVELLAQNLQWLDEMERIALYEVNQAETSVIKITDPVTQLVTEQRMVDPNKGKFFQSALKAREMKLKILLDTGILPRNKVEMFEKLAGYETKVTRDDTDERTPEQVREAIERLLRHGRFMEAASSKANE